MIRKILWVRGKVPSLNYFGKGNMKPKSLIVTILMISCLLLLHAGCEEETMAPRQQLSQDFFKKFNHIQQSSRPVATTRTTVRTRRTPKIEFEKVMHDFGNVGPRTNNLCEFRFTNAGNSTLKIGEIVNTCGCTPFVLEKKEYAPGESGTLKVNYFSEAQYGQTTKNLEFYSNDRTQPKVILAVKANIMMKIDYEPKTLSLLLNKENADCQQITITSIDNQPFSINSFKSTANCITADFNPSEKATKFVLQPKVDMARLGKTLNGRIEIGIDHPECKTISVGMSTLPQFKISPRAIIVRGSASRQPIVKKLVILNNYDEDFELESVWSTKGMVKVLSNSIVNDGYELELEITPPASGSKRRSLTEKFFIKTKAGPQIEVPCNVYYTKQIPKSLTSKTDDDKECKTCTPKIFDFTKGTVTPYPTAK